MTVVKRAGLGVAFAVAGLAVVPSLASAQMEVGPWRYEASLYGFLPSVSGSTSVPVDTGGTPINIDADQLISGLKFTFMGAFEAHNGRWGVFTDILYLDLGADKQQSRDFTIGNIGLPADTTADLAIDFKGLVWTLGGEYRAVTDPDGLTLNVIAGARLLDLKQTLRWSIAGDLGPIAAPGRSGSFETEESGWDGIVGIKGRFALGGAGGRWSVPFYADVGTGASDLTWQASAGLSYAYSWGSVTLVYRHLAYEMKSGRPIQDVSLSGPQLGVAFRW